MDNRKTKILAIDNVAENLILLKALIRRVLQGARVPTALNGEEGIKKALKEDPDVIILEASMPAMDGYEVCRKIKSHEKLAGIPVVFYSAQGAEKGNRIQALEAGAEAFLSKPLDEAELGAQLRAMVRKRAEREENRANEKRLTKLVEEQTRELKRTHQATLNLLQELKKENDARKQNESALQESENRYRAFFGNSMDAILLTHPNGEIREANAAACEMFGMTEEEIISAGRTGLVDITDGRLKDLVAEREKKGKVKGELRFRRKNGEIFTAELTSAIYESSSGEKFTSMIIRDVSQSIIAKQNLENERLLLRTIINNLPDVIHCKDEKGRRTLSNATEVKLLKARSEKEVIGKNDVELYPAGIANRFHAYEQSVLQTGKPVINKEELLVDDFGEKKWLLISKIPLYNTIGQISGLIGIARNITALKRRVFVQQLQYNMATAMVNRKSLQELFTIIKTDLNQLMEAENLTLAMMNYESGMLYSPVDFEDNGENPQSWPADGSLTGWVIQQKKSCLYTYDELEALAETQGLKRYGPKSQCWMGVPLFDGEQVAGVIILQSYRNPKAYDWDSVRKVEIVASQFSSYMKRLHAEETALKLSKAVEQSPDTIMITDTNGVIEYVNSRFTEHTGYTQEEAVGRTPGLLHSGKHPASFYKELWDTLLAGKDWHGEVLNRRKDGTLYWENSSISPLVNSSGEVTHFVAVKEEITEKKQTEEALKYHSALQAVLIKIASGFINVNLENLDRGIKASLAEMGKFAAADRSYIFEYDWDKKITKNTYEWCADGITPQIDNLQDLDINMLGAFSIPHRKGEVFYLEDVHSLPVDDPLRLVLEPQDIKSTIALPMMEGTKCTGFVGFDWVIENHAYSDGEKVLLNIFSQLLVNVNLKIKLEKRLIIEKEKAEAADRLKTAFLNNISHEVRTPLNGILGFGNILMLPDITQVEKEEYYKVLQKSSNRLVHTINSYMDISLLTSGNMPVEKKKFSVHNLLYEIYERYSNENQSQVVQLKIDLNGYKNDQYFESDPELLKKVLMHLLDNAVKFTPAGNIRFGYVLKSNRIEFFVEDTGIGIDSEMINKVFDNFVQEDPSLSRGYEGNGLGLSISKGLVELLGGTIALSSMKGSGTSVKFSIPFSEEQNDPSRIEEHHTDDLKPLVLIAEDDVVNQFYLKTILKLGNFECTTVKNGILAVEECKKNPRIGLVLMDIKMPLMGGLEATRQIRQFHPELPILAVTALAMKEDRKMALEAGCNDYLAKPFKKEVLLEKVSFYINQPAALKGKSVEPDRYSE